MKFFFTQEEVLSKTLEASFIAFVRIKSNTEHLNGSIGTHMSSYSLNNSLLKKQMKRLHH